MTNPRVSICIPVYNAEKTISETLDSVLAQTFDDFEIVIVDNASTDATVDVMRRFTDPRISFSVNDQNYGPVENWNRVVEAAKGQYIKVVCADDLLEATILERQVSTLDAPQNDDVVLVACRRKIIDESGHVIMAARGLPGINGRVNGKMAIRKTIRSGSNPMGEPAAVMVRSEVLKKCLPWSGDHPYLIDVDMWIRVLEHGDLYGIQETLCSFRVGQASWSRQVVSQQRSQTVGMFKKARARRPDIITPVDLAVGSVKAAVAAIGRRGVYMVLERKRRNDKTAPHLSVVK